MSNPETALIFKAFLIYTTRLNKVLPLNPWENARSLWLSCNFHQLLGWNNLSDYILPCGYLYSGQCLNQAIFIISKNLKKRFSSV